MAITMQGSWTVSVKSKNASFDQRFVISGASRGNGPDRVTDGRDGYPLAVFWQDVIGLSL